MKDIVNRIRGKTTKEVMTYIKWETKKIYRHIIYNLIKTIGFQDNSEFNNFFDFVQTQCNNIGVTKKHEIYIANQYMQHRYDLLGSG